MSQPGPQSPTAVLTGAPGSGKTELAATYARARLADGWRLIAWLDAQDGRSLLTGLAAVAEAVGISAGGPRRPAADTGRLVRQWLEADGRRCLLVFDGAQEPGLLRPFVPAAGAARVLITAADEQVSELGTAVPVGAFGTEEALAVLGGRVGRADDADASALAAELAHLPLALDLAAAVIAEQHVACAEFLARLQSRPPRQDLAQPHHLEPPDEPDRPGRHGVTEAVQLAVDTVGEADRLGVCTGVLQLMALLSRAGVRREVLHAAGRAGTLLGRGRRVAAPMVNRALDVLREQSLLGSSLDGQVITMHSLVARVVRDDMKRRGDFAAQCRSAAATVQLSAEAFASPAGGALAADMLGQVTALLEHMRAAGAGADDGLLLRLQVLALHLLAELGDSWPEIIAIGEPLLAELSRVLGADDKDSIRIQNDLAHAYREAGRTAESVRLLEQSLAAEEKLLGAYHPSTLASRNNLGSAYRAAGRPDAAITVFEQNVAVCERILGAEHPKTRASQHSLDLARREAGRAESGRAESGRAESGRPGG